MITETVDAKELFTCLDETWNELLDLISFTDEKLVNKVPFEESWTVGQLARHVTKSNHEMVQLLKLRGETANRGLADGEPNLKNIFLNFDAKYNAPESIVPETKHSDKQALLDDLKKSIQQLKEERAKQDLSKLLNVDLLGQLTKLELYYFILYHTQRHIHQLKNMLKVL
jgi:hypothetical protein